MNIPGSNGEPSCNSCKRQENGDGNTESERPLKKARFAWQVKGRYHLKNEIPESRDGLNSHDSSSMRSSEHEIESKELAGNTEQNLEILGDYLLKQDFNTADSMTEPEHPLIPSTSLSTAKLSYPRYISSTSNIILNERVNNTDLCHISNSLVNNNSISDLEDKCIARWQTKQMAKCLVDNTINRVLDNWTIAPLPTDVDPNRFLAFDVAEFINNLPADNSVIENEGILMAISAHGLQNTSNSSNDSTNFSLQNDSSNKDLYLLSPSSPSDEDIHDSNISSKESQTESPSNEMDMSWLYTENVKQSANNEPITFFPEGSSSSYQSYNETEDIQNSNEYDADDNINFKDNDIVNDHYDFLDAAVSFAIQYKGLTSLGTDG